MDYQNLCLGCMEAKGEAKTCPHCGYEEGATTESLLHLPPGTILQDKFLLGRALGQGGFGITYLAWDMTLNIKLAIKEFLPQQLVTRLGGSHEVTVYRSSLTEDFIFGLTRFMEEALTMARFIEHPSVVSVRDYFEANGTAYLVMNYYEGVTLQRYLESKGKGGRIIVEQAMQIFMPVLDALKEVHAVGILHRDISPDNLLIDRKGRVILIDFGAARQAMGEKSKSLSVITKAGFSPEEQYRSKGEQGPWTDIYAVAATFYRSITGQMPPESLDRLVEDPLVAPSNMGVEIKPFQEKALLKALAVSAKDRFRKVSDMQKALLSETADLQHNIPEVEQFTATAENDEMPDNQEASSSIETGSIDLHNSQSDSFSGFITVATIIVLIVIGLIAYEFYRIPQNEWHGGTYVGEMEEEIPHGYGEWSNESGEKYIGEWIDGQRHGQGTYWFNDGKHYTGEWEANVQNGIGAYIYADGKMIAGVLENGILLSASYYIPEIDAEILGLRFYESDGRRVELDDRVYLDNFSAEETRYIVSEIHLEYHEDVNERTTNLLQVFFKSDGSKKKWSRAESGAREWLLTIPPEWSGSWHTYGFGREEPGFWEPDTYQVLIIADDKPAILGTFTVY